MLSERQFIDLTSSLNYFKFQALGGNMCFVCVTVAGTIVVASQLVPVEVLSSPAPVQKTLTSFSTSSVTLSNRQKSEIESLVEQNPNAEKFICTGIRFESAPLSQNIVVRKRAKAACDYAKQLNPRLSTWFQNKPTKARNFAGRVILTLKSSSASAPTLPISNDQPSISSDSVELCKLRETSQRRGYTWAGFPQLTPMTQKTGTVKWALIPIDFEDLPGDKAWRLRLEKETQLISEWFDTVSEGKFKVEWVIADNWIRVPGVSSDYPVTKVRGQNNTPGGIKLFQTAMAAADPYFDFSGVQTVNFMLPMNQDIAKEGENGFPWDQHVKDVVTDEGSVSSFTISGQYQTRPDAPLWAYWMHEFGHAIGLPHIGSGGPDVPPFNEWDIMGSQDGQSLELSGWIRFLAGWMPDERVYCKDPKSISRLEISLVPLSNKEAGTKFAMFPLSGTKALLVESRRVTKFSCATPTPRNGVLVYVLDLTLGHGQDFLVPLSPPNRTTAERSTCNGFPSYSSLDVLLKEGDKVTYEGLTVEVLRHGNVDKIALTR
jgi:M6 family metalloprotease-like protein